MAEDVLYVGTHGPEDPTRATLVFAAALAMRAKKENDRAIPVKVALLGQGVLLLDRGIAAGIKVVGQRPSYPTLDLLMAAVVDPKVGVEIHC